MAFVPTKHCGVCEKLFEKPVNCSRVNWTVRNYCSHGCYWKSKLGKPSWNKGKPTSEEHKILLRKKKPMSEAGKQSLRDAYRSGRLRPWNKVGDGITPVNERIRKSPEYREWRQQVYKRDNFTCVECERRGGDLQADHIKPFALYPQLRFDVTNGRTLCKPCHRKTETYGINQHTYPQLKQTQNLNLTGSVA